MKKLIVYIKNFILKLSFLLKVSWQSFYQRLFLVWSLGLRGACILLLLMFLSMVTTISCGSDVSSPAAYKFSPVRGSVDSDDFRAKYNSIKISSDVEQIVFNFNEDITGFTMDDIEFDNVYEKLSFSSDSKSKYTLQVQANKHGRFVLKIRQGGFRYDASGELNPEFRWRGRVTQWMLRNIPVPQVAISIKNNKPFRKGEPNKMIFTFREGASDFTLDDIEFTGVDLAKGKFITNSDRSYTLTVIPKAIGKFTATIPEGSVEFSGGRNSKSATVDVDVGEGIISQITISTNDSMPFRKGEPEKITFTFIEGVSDFNLDDIKISNVNVAKGKFIANSDSSYTLTVIPKTNGKMTVTIPEDSVYLKDSGVRNTESATVDIAVGKEKGSQITISTNDSKPFRKGELEKITFTFIEGVNDFTLNDIDFTGVDVAKGKLVASNDSSYTLTVIPKAIGKMTVTIPEGRVEFVSGINNTESATVDIDVGKGRVAQLIISTNNTNPFRKGEPSEITFTFREGVSDLTLDDIEFTGVDAAKGKLVTNSDSSYTLTVIPKATGKMTVTIPEGSVEFVSGGVRNTESATVDIDVGEGKVSQLTISTNNTNPFRKGEPEKITFAFREGVSDLTLDDIEFTGVDAAKGKLVTNSDSSYTLTVIPKATGKMTVTIPEDRVYLKDSGVRNTESATVDIDVEEGEVSQLTISTNNTNPFKKGESSEITFTFREGVSDFTLDDIEFTGVDVAKGKFVTNSDSSYTLTVIPKDAGKMTVTIPEDRVYLKDSGVRNTESATVDIDVIKDT